MVKDIQQISARFGTKFEVSKDDVAVTLEEASENNRRSKGDICLLLCHEPTFRF